MFFDVFIYGKYKLKFKTIYQTETEKEIKKYQRTVTGSKFINIINELLNDVNIISFTIFTNENIISIRCFDETNGKSFITHIKYENR